MGSYIFYLFMYLRGGRGREGETNCEREKGEIENKLSVILHSTDSLRYTQWPGMNTLELRAGNTSQPAHVGSRSPNLSHHTLGVCISRELVSGAGVWN